MSQDKSGQWDAEADKEPWSPWEKGKKGSGGPDAVPGSRAASDASGSEASTATSGSKVKVKQEGWPKVQCSTEGCETKAHALKKMRSTKHYTHRQKSLNDPDDVWHWEYTCLKCIMKEKGCDEKEALATIQEELPNPKWARKRSIEFKTAMEKTNEDCEGLSRRGKRKLVLEDMIEILAPFADYVLRKMCQLAARKKGIEEYDALLVELRKSQTKNREMELMDLLEEWDAKLAELNAPLAFAGFGAVEQEKMFNVAQHSDEWVNTPKECLRAWYICLQDWKETWPACGTLMPSQLWRRRHSDPSRSKQRYYCVCCETVYKTRFGMLVEFHCKGVSTFMLAEVSNTDQEDIRAMYLEDKFQAKDAKELFKKLPIVQPMDPEYILRPATKEEVQMADVDYTTIMKIKNPAALKELPRWDWDKVLVLKQELI